MDQNLPKSLSEPTVKIKKSWLKNALVLVALFLTGMGFYGAYYYGKNSTPVSQIPSPTATTSATSSVVKSDKWNTYSNFNPSYQIDYPSDWSMKDLGGENFAFYPSSDTESDPNTVFVIVLPKLSTEQKTFAPLEEYVKKYAPQEIQDHNKVTLTEKITTDSGVVGYTLTYDLAGSISNAAVDIRTYFPIPGDNKNTLQVTTNAKNNSIYKQMLKTVKISDVTANWKTYTNPKFGYSVKYPSDKLIRMNCPDEELDLVPLTANNKNTDESKVLETCGRDGRFTFQTNTVDLKPAPATIPDYSVKQTKVTVNGKEVVVIEVTLVNPQEGPAEAWYKEAYLNHGSKTTIFSVSNQNSIDLFEQILPTFKFTD